MEPFEVLSLGTKGLKDVFTGRQKRKSEKELIREKKRKTLADLLNASLEREFKGGEGQRDRASQMALGRSQALQNLAAQYVAALARR